MSEPLKKNQRLMTSAEYVAYLGRRDEKSPDLALYEPIVSKDEHGQEWVIYRRREALTP